MITTDSEVSKGDTISATDTKGNEVGYRITGSSTVSYTIKETDGKAVIVPNTVTINDTTYRVTRIQNGAMKGNDSIKKVVIGDNVRVIGAKAFANCDSLKNIVIDGENLSKIGNKAFKGIAKNATIRVTGTKSEFKATKKLIKASGVAGTIKIKRA